MQSSHPLTASYYMHQEQTAKFCLQNHPDVPSPDGFGWELDENASLSIRWNNVKPASDGVLELMHCTCARKCIQGSLPCIDNSLLCTDACAKQDCEHFIELDENENEELEYSSEEDDF